MIPRLFVTDELTGGASIGCNTAQVHYLRHVLRLDNGAAIRLFNGRDGEWRAELEAAGRKRCALAVQERLRPQTPQPELHYLFAPLKRSRLDYMAQKATEMGAGVLQPVLTRFTMVRRIRGDRLCANAVEAAEQCGLLAVPRVKDPLPLARLLDEWSPGRALVFCDESAAARSPLDDLLPLAGRPLAVLIGPEGGFAPEERRRLLSLPFVTPISLGPRIMRADTAAVAALALVQAMIGDWNSGGNPG